MKSVIQRYFQILFIAICLSHSIFAQGLRLSPGVHLVMSGNPSLVLNNAGLINDGSIETDSSTVVFTDDGTMGVARVGGSNPINFHNLSIRKTSGNLELDNDISVNGNIFMQGGNLLLNDHLLDLGNSGIIQGENNLSFITGTHGGSIRRLAVIGANMPSNPGNIGVEITSSKSPGQTIITRSHTQQTMKDGNTSVQRYFEITPSLNADLDATVRLYYLDSELGDKSKTELSIFGSIWAGNPWSITGNDKNDPENRWVVKSHLDQLHLFTLATINKKVIDVAAVESFQRLYPNPTPNSFTLVLKSASEKDEFAHINDAQGHLLEIHKFHCFQGNNKFSWDIGRYPSGVYMIIFQDQNFHSIKVIKQ